MAKIQDIDIPHLEFAEAAAPGTPAAGIVRIYSKTDGLLYSKDDAGAETLLSSGAVGSVATDAIWDTKGDIAVATGADAASKLAAGTDGHVLTADSAQATGLKWAAAAAGGAVATDAIWDAAGDLAVGSGADTAARLAIGTSGYVLTSNGTTATWAAASGGGGSLYPLDDRTLHATYGDHFTAASLDTGLWTRRNYVSGAETAQVGSTYLRISASGRSNGDGYFQTAPAGDFTVEMKYIPRLYQTTYPNFGPAIIDSSGNGVCAMFYAGSPNAVILAKVATYGTYDSAYVQPGGGQDNISAWASNLMVEHPVWLRVRKATNNYYVNYSLDGETWSVESSALAYTITVDRIGMLHGPLGTAATGASIANRMDVDWFDVV